MIHFTILYTLVVSGMVAIQPAAAAVLSDHLLIRRNFNINMFQRRQGNPAVPPQCATICDPVNSIIGNLGNCTPSECCSATFENSYFNCLTCAEAAVNVTDYTSAQMTVDALYDQCASLGIQLPILTFPGQNPNRPLSSVILPTVSQSTVSTIASGSTPSQSIVPSTVGPSNVGSSTSPATTTASTQATATTTTPTPTSSSSFGTRSTETNCFNLFFAAMMLGTWFYCVV